MSFLGPVSSNSPYGTMQNEGLVNTPTAAVADSDFTLDQESLFVWMQKVSDCVVCFFKDMLSSDQTSLPKTEQTLLPDTSLENNMIKFDLESDDELLNENQKLKSVNQYLRNRYYKKSRMLAKTSNDLDVALQENEMYKGIIALALVRQPTLLKDYQYNLAEKRKQELLVSPSVG